jgi:GH15 family glucan-1,4-alpha-glucosidase
MRRFIEDFGLIGDLHTAALVSQDGSIEWFCAPRFDSDGPFMSLLGGPENGSWTLAPVKAIVSSQRRYRGNTLVLETTLRCEDGTVRLIDFMPRRDQQPTLVRIVEGVEGNVEMQCRIACRFSYGSLPPWTRKLGDTLAMTIGSDALTLHSSIEHELEDSDACAHFSIRPRKRTTFVLQWHASHERPPRARNAEMLLRKTEAEWRRWSARCKYRGLHRESVLRSVITLKALIFEPTGGSTAAVTTSLPEDLGGSSNWDYRYSWLRDSAFTVDALVGCGYHAEARAWRDWLLRVLGGEPGRLQIMYAVNGDRRLPEWQTELAGYEGSRPVRAGNDAYRQFQLGIYGHVMQAVFTAHAGARVKIDDQAWAMLSRLIEHVCDTWQAPDSGIWEYRDEEQHYTTSRVMAWVALDCALKLVESDGYAAPKTRWTEARNNIHAEVCERAFSRKRGAFVQSYECDDLDASVLLIPLVEFLPADDQRVRSTLQAIEDELMIEGFVMRDSRHVEPRGAGGRPTEGAFLACNMWMVENYVLAGRLQAAQDLFERVAGIASDLGLLSEQYDVRYRRLVGNFPQTFSHATLVNAAVRLSEATSRK